jgi:hypothetical protein
MSDEKYAKFGGESTDEAPDPKDVIGFMAMLDQLIKEGHGLTVEPDAVPPIAAGIRHLEQREHKLREAVRAVNPESPLLAEAEGFRLIVTD